jgi:hypothetical protein
MHMTLRTSIPLALALAFTSPLLAQTTGLPTSQPGMLVIYQEDVKVGHRADHEKTEVGWPAAFERAKFPDYYIALVSMTGPNVAWFVQPTESNAAIGESLKREFGDPTLRAELERLSRADAEHLTGQRTIHAVARKDLSYGAYPDTTRERFWEITTFRVRPGHSMAFAEAVKAYGAAVKRAGLTISYRTYEVVAGEPSPTYLVFVSAPALGAFDATMQHEEAMWKAATTEERGVLDKAMKESVLMTVTQRFALNGPMSHVPREVRDQDSDFWKPAPKRQTMAVPARTPGAAGLPQP